MMKNKILYFIGAFLFLCGALAVGASALYCDFSFSAMTGHPVEQEYHEFSADFSRIVISETDADVIVTDSLTDSMKLTIVRDDKTCYNVTTYEADGGKVLAIGKTSSRMWYDYIFNLDFSDYRIELEIPRELMTDLEISGRSSHVVLERIGCRSISVYTENGQVTVTDTDTKEDITACSETSYVYLQHVSAGGKAEIRSSYGVLVLRNVEAKELVVSSVNDNVELYTVASDVISAKTESGRIVFEGCDFTKKLSLTSIYGNIDGILGGEMSDYSVSTFAATKNTLPKLYEGGSRQVQMYAYNGAIRVTVGASSGADADTYSPETDDRETEALPETDGTSSEGDGTSSERDGTSSETDGTDTAPVTHSDTAPESTDSLETHSPEGEQSSFILL